MPGEVVNLRLARKRKKRVDEAAGAEANRAAHGVPKAVRDLGKARAEKAERMHEGHRLGAEDDPPADR